MKQEKLVKKIKRLLKRARIPRWLHRFGPKKYEFYQHALALLVRELCKLSYRRASRLLNALDVTVPTYSALAKMVKRVPRALWNALLTATVGFKWTNVAAADGTYYTRTSPSFHYLKRIKRGLPLKKAVQVTALLDTRRKKWLALSTRLRRVHEAREVQPLLRKSPVPVLQLVMDKIADWEALHRDLERAWHVQPHVPVKKNVVRGAYRKKHAACFRLKTYHRRELIESSFSKNKRTQGQAVKNRLAKTIRTEITLRYVNDNLSLLAQIAKIFNTAGFENHSQTFLRCPTSDGFWRLLKNKIVS